ncbi:hypothetical protein PsorP6_000872 [Peronosclerospora sorghi]|uniref:Uncharacterized protein n=1 Tax=Peronosclerospora sorghi TaxID=230839 RepID=A0ACC0WUV6_9STRA|nr:hypothetical protein PsorP6_000872 [Peronosclerospora sorghi]
MRSDFYALAHIGAIKIQLPLLSSLPGALREILNFQSHFFVDDCRIFCTRVATTSSRRNIIV